jgi:hypothetical protein
MRQLILCLFFSCALLERAGAATATAPDGGFSRYILAAVKMLGETRGAKGYADSAFTQDLQFGDAGLLKASSPPTTMCVAAQLETLVEALNIYSERTKDYSPFHFLPKIMWTRQRPLDFRGMIWIIDRTKSTGAGSAFERYGLGRSLAFKDMFPGAFLNFNRTNKTGHAVVFLGFIDKNGDDLANYSDAVAGFRYFSSQGKDKPDGGLGYRFAFFSNAGCPNIAQDKKRDCGVIRSEKNGYLAGGYVSIPTNWDREKANSAILTNNEMTDPALTAEGSFDGSFFTGVTTDD